MLCHRLARTAICQNAGRQALRFFNGTVICAKKVDQLPPRPTLPDDELHHTFLKGSGPGGQKINKTNSACQLTHLPTGIVVKSQATRSRSQNYNIARRILAEKVELINKGDESRVVKKAERASKKKASADKKKKRKYKKLAEGPESDAEVRDTLAEGGTDTGPVTQGGKESEVDSHVRERNG